MFEEAYGLIAEACGDVHSERAVKNVASKLGFRW
jgi:hypothetical protein